jgi:Fe-S cluster assembly iron-binding protein IscA
MQEEALNQVEETRDDQVEEAEFVEVGVEPTDSSDDQINEESQDSEEEKDEHVEYFEKV